MTQDRETINSKAKTNRLDRVSDRRIDDPGIIKTFANFTDACARLKTPCYGEPDLFFPDNTDRAMVERAKQRCSTCPLIDKCLNFALDARQNDGVWGGLSEDERRKILRARRATKQRRWKAQREARVPATQTALFELTGA